MNRPQMPSNPSLVEVQGEDVAENMTHFASTGWGAAQGQSVSKINKHRNFEQQVEDDTSGCTAIFKPFVPMSYLPCVHSGVCVVILGLWKRTAHSLQYNVRILSCNLVVSGCRWQTSYTDQLCPISKPPASPTLGSPDIFSHFRVGGLSVRKFAGKRLCRIPTKRVQLYGNRFNGLVPEPWPTPQ
uniref:Uncharacterized protein n=1 Tax=Eutreptiella gymnastica TaxID=73025 RepID=A0A7S1HVK6_9EUGL